MEFETILRVVCALGYFGTFIIIASYHPRQSSWRPGVSLFAVGLAGSSAGLAVIVAMGLLQQVIGSLLWALCAQCLCVFALVARCRGNLAKLLPRFKQRSPV
jgi:hypothetical protein